MEFIRYTYEHRTALVRTEWAGDLAGALLLGKMCEPVELGGRGTLRRCFFEGGTGIVRTFRRGGFVRHFVERSYLMHNRPLQEFRIHTALYSGGLAVPEPLGVLWERRGVFFRGAIATREIEGRDLLEYLSTKPEAPERALDQAGRLIREMHDMGVCHADLQVGNILVAALQTYLIDFDKATRHETLSTPQRARNLSRLKRSFDKHFIPADNFIQLLKGYGGGDIPEWMESHLPHTEEPREPSPLVTPHDRAPHE